MQPRAMDQDDYDAWRVFACCRGRTSLFFAEGRAGETAARHLCRNCPVAVECLTDSISRQGDEVGIWAGLGINPRIALKRTVRDQRIRPCAQPHNNHADECRWCKTMVKAMFATKQNHNSSKARHGHISTAARSCRCSGCRHEASYVRRRDRNAAEHQTATLKPEAMWPRTRPLCEPHNTPDCRACQYDRAKH